MPGLKTCWSRRPRLLPKSRTAPAGCMAVLGAVSDEWPATIARAIKKVCLDMLASLRARIEGGGRQRRAARCDGHRCPEPVLPRRLPGNGHPGQGRRLARGVERRSQWRAHGRAAGRQESCVSPGAFRPAERRRQRAIARPIGPSDLRQCRHPGHGVLGRKFDLVSRPNPKRGPSLPAEGGDRSETGGR